MPGSVSEAPSSDMPAKTKDVSWVTSTLAFLPGHKRRVRLLEKLRPSGIVDLYGRGLNPIARKWEAMSTYRYSIAYENPEVDRLLEAEPRHAKALVLKAQFLMAAESSSAFQMQNWLSLPK